MSAPRDGAAVQILHALPRRVRLRAPAIAGHRAACERIARAIADEGTFDRVTARPSTGSLIIEGADGTLAADVIAARVRELLATERDDEGRRLTSLGPERHPGPTRVARAVAHAFAGINCDVRVALDHRADLGTLLPVFFATAGLAEVAVTGRLPAPTWFNLLWWSVRSFMTFNVSAVEAEAEAAAAEHPDVARRRSA